MTEATSAPRPNHHTAAQELQPRLCLRERWRCGIPSEGLADRMVSAVVAISADPYCSHSGVLPSHGTHTGSSQVQGHIRPGSCMGWACTGSRGFLLLQQTQAESKLRCIYRVLTARTHVHRECCKSISNYLFQTSKYVT